MASAEGEAFRFEQLLAEYQRHPPSCVSALHRRHSGSAANTSKILIDVEGGNNMMFLPLDRLMDQGGSPRRAAPRMTVSVKQSADS
jgi:modulator of FtsH protease HflK